MSRSQTSCQRDIVIEQRETLAQQQNSSRALEILALRQQQVGEDSVHERTQSQAHSEHLQALINTLQARIPLPMQRLQAQNRLLHQQVQIQQDFINSSSPRATAFATTA